MHAFIAMIVTQGLAFLALFAILKKFAFKPVLNAIDTRRAHIENEFGKINEGRAEVMKTQKEYQDRLAQIEDEARIKIRDAIKEGQQMAEQIKAGAQKEASELIEKTQELLQSERAKAAVAIRDHIIELTMSASEKLIRERMDDEKHRELISSFIEEMPTIRS